MLSSTIFFQGVGEDEEEEDSESSASLSAPLLLRSNDGRTISEQDIDEIAVPAATAATAGSTIATDDNNMAGYHTVGTGVGRSGGISNTTSRSYRLLRRCVQWKSAADALPMPFHVVVTNGKICALATIGCYLLFISLWLPFWLLSFLLTEYGVYVMVVCTIFFVGRSIIRLIAFPGTSQKITKEIETEFAKYSVRMIVSASQAMSELASAIIHTLEAKLVANAAGGSKSSSPAQVAPPHGNIPGLWRRAKMVRDRVLGVYLEVLLYLYQQSPTSCNNSNQQDAFINKFGNNRLQGDVGTLGNLTMEAKRDGRDLMNRLQQVMSLIESLEHRNAAGPLLDGSASAASVSAAIGSGMEEALQTARQLLHVANDLRDFCASLRPPSSSSSEENDENTNGGGEDGDDIDDIGAAMRRRIETEGAATSALELVKTGCSSIMGMLDPPPNPSIFGMDVQRGCMLSRYRGARQFWVTRGKGGMIDALHFPAIPTRTNMGTAPSPNNTKAVLYCNPNAGLIEVATGLSLVAGNVPSAEADSNGHGDSWIDFYTSLGFDVYVFNYAGYGRSYGKTMCSSSTPANSDNYYVAGIFAKLCRIFRSCFLGFQPTPDTLRADGFDVAEHVCNQFGVEKLVIHGESIGGVAASGTARRLTSTTRNVVSLLICDRTFCNLEAVAQRLVGGWTGYAIRTLTLFSWSTDVAGDFLAAACPKVVANDSSDAIISDEASLKSGVALWKEIHRGIATTKGIGWMKETPLQYRMADFENVCVNDSKYVAGSFLRTQPPTWPTDKHITVEEAFHFAACCKRIGKVATQTQRGMMRDQELSGFVDGGGGTEVSNNPAGSGGVVHSEPLVLEAWKYLATCDGLTGLTLGVAVKRGFDACVAWLCSGLVFGGQAVVDKASRRRSPANKGKGGLDPNPTANKASLKVTVADFDNRPAGYTYEERNDGVIHPKPIPEVVERLVFLLETGDESMRHLSHEFQFVLGVLQYMQARLSSPAAVESALKCHSLDVLEESGVGCFMNLHCGHNNAFTREEKMQLQTILEKATTNSQQEQQHSIV